MTEKQTVQLDSETIRLDQLLKYSAVVATGGDAKYLIQQGFVSLNHDICKMRGKKVAAGDQVQVEFEDQTIVLNIIQG